MFKSATFKLTMYYLAIIAVISIGFSVAIYKVVSHDLAFGLNRQSQRISRDFPVFSNSPYLRPGDELKETKDHLLGRLILLNVFVLIGAGGLSYLLARRTLQPIEAAHEQQKRFTADVSHELRTPLTALKMESEVALMDTSASKSELRDVIKSNVEESEKLTSLVSNLLRLSQLDDDAKLAMLTEISLSDAVMSAIDQLAMVAQKRDMSIVSTVQADVYVRGEMATLTQLFSTLIENAVKYSADGSNVEIEVKTSQQVAQVIIKDSGAGIAKDDLDHVFERFYRADSSRTGTNGFGLGLSIAKLIADSHQGSISLSSRAGKGTTATVTLPLAPALTQLPTETTK